MRSRAGACAGTRGSPTIPDRGQLAIRLRRERIPLLVSAAIVLAGRKLDERRDPAHRWEQRSNAASQPFVQRSETAQRRTEDKSGVCAACQWRPSAVNFSTARSSNA